MSVSPNVLPNNLSHCDLYFMVYVVILLNIRYRVGYLNNVFCSNESVGLNVHAKHKNMSP